MIVFLKFIHSTYSSVINHREINDYSHVLISRYIYCLKLKN